MFKVLSQVGGLDPTNMQEMCEGLEQWLNELRATFEGMKIHSLHSQVIEATGKFLLIAIAEVEEKATK